MAWLGPRGHFARASSGWGGHLWLARTADVAGMLASSLVRIVICEAESRDRPERVVHDVGRSDQRLHILVAAAAICNFAASAVDLFMVQHRSFHLHRRYAAGYGFRHPFGGLLPMARRVSCNRDCMHSAHARFDQRTFVNDKYLSNEYP